MLLIRCAGCKRKLWRYDKIGKGEVLRCHKTRITQDLADIVPQEQAIGQKVVCPCGKPIGIDKGSFIKMIRRAFIYSGEKRGS